MNSTEKDSYSLDDTLTGRLVQAGIAGAFVAAPDYVSSKAGKFWARTALLGAGIGAVAVANAMEEDEGEEPEDFALEEPGPPLLTWAIVGAGGAVLAGLAAGEDALANRMRRRGVRRPHTRLGAIVGGAVLVASEVNHRRHEAA